MADNRVTETVDAVVKQFTRVERGGDSPTGWTGKPFLDVDAMAAEIVKLQSQLTAAQPDARQTELQQEQEQTLNAISDALGPALGIPYYAYGDNEAACVMASAVNQAAAICDAALAAIAASHPAAADE